MTAEPIESPALSRQTHPLFSSVLRELWENRSIYLAPLAGAGIAFVGFMVSTIGMPARRRAVLLLDPEKQRATIAQPYDAIATALILVAMIVGFFYCLDALYGERRERSILFWKSMPVSDRTTVLSKAAVPFVVLPLITLVIVPITHFMMMIWTSIVLLPSGLAGTTWTRFNLVEQTAILAYGVIALVLWHAPIYGWLLLISAWAKRAPFLWAVLPPFAIAAIERIVSHTSYFRAFLRHRFLGHVGRAFVLDEHGLHSVSQLAPVKFLVTPGLWVGLGFAAIFLTAAARLRRDREPM